MKRIFSIALAVVAALPMTVMAQRAGEFNLDNTDDWSYSGVFAELGAGVALGDLDADLGLSVGVGYRYHFGGGFCWDIAKVTYYNPQLTQYPGDASSLRFITAARYNSAPILADRPLYVTFGVGYQLNVVDTDYWKGFAYEIGAGVALSRNVSLGLVWEGNVAYWGDGYDNSNFGILGAKLGVQF